MTEVSIRNSRLQRWMNIRKVTPAHLAERCHKPASFIRDLLDQESLGTVEHPVLEAIADALDIQPQALLDPAKDELRVLIQTADELYRTKRAISREGRHFYNYYTLPSPKGYIAPVILDILCPTGTLPTLNNGHLEPAITVNLGPGDIYARWGEDITPETWQKLEASPGDWIVGDSYIEASYCPHAYGLASQVGARILSYTADSYLGALVDELKTWSPTAVNEFLQHHLNHDAFIEFLLSSRGFEWSTLARQVGREVEYVRGVLLSGSARELRGLREIANALNVDYRVLLQTDGDLDSVGKRVLTSSEARRGARHFRSYGVADVARAAELSGLSGFFMRVSEGHQAFDMADSLCSASYLVTSGTLNFHWRESGRERHIRVSTDDAMWVPPCIAHGFSGAGALLRMSSSAPSLTIPRMSENLELHQAKATISRAYTDAEQWGHDGDG